MSDEEFQLAVRAVKRDLDLMKARLENIEGKIDRAIRRENYDNE